MGAVQMGRVAILAAAMGLALTACGSDTGTDAVADDTSSTAATTEPGSPSAEGPSCADVWVEGADLATSYDGCVDDTGFVEPEILECSSGQRIVLFDDQYWALRGNRIGYAPDGLAASDDYGRVLTSCRA